MGFRTGLGAFWLGLGAARVPFDEAVLWPGEGLMAEVVLADRTELPESDVPLVRRVRTGMRDCEWRLECPEKSFGGVPSAGGDVVITCVPKALALDGFAEIPAKSLLVLLCIPMAWDDAGLFVCIPSSEGVTPEYQAVGDDGDTLKAMGLLSSGNMGFGLCMLPSEPRRRGMP